MRGIICYRDERGEIICEGYDEGSRHSHHLSSENGKRICEGYNERPRYHLRSPAQVEETVCEAYDDQVKGIICCRDKTGEIICEGIDEGPRYSYRSSSQNTYEARYRRKHISSRINSNHMSHWEVRLRIYKLSYRCQGTCWYYLQVIQVSKHGF